eukprot:TRINITY_DN4997_c0_g1_i1.p1 TRINITY_DN4997_c0_g1~~TRINITY_DN4997_c0_g1_i1.p1  ORF type:complete len:746 (-),score=154.01 TRINITY_DN4997_c0_g1_i1:1937-4174(-)
MDEKLVAVERICQRLIAEGHYEQGIRYLELLLHLRVKRFGDVSDEAWEALQWLVEQSNAQAMRALDKGNHVESLKLLRRAKQLSASQGWGFQATKQRLKCRAVTLNNFACYCRRMSNLDEALNYAKSALSIEAQLDIKDVENPAGTLLNICAILSQLGRHAEAHIYCQKTINLLRSQPMDSKNATSMGMAYYNLAVEQEHLKVDVETCFHTYRDGIRFCETYLGIDHSFTALLRSAFQEAKAQAQKMRESQMRITSPSKGDRILPSINLSPAARKAPGGEPNREDVLKLTKKDFETSKPVSEDEPVLGLQDQESCQPNHTETSQNKPTDLDSDDDEVLLERMAELNSKSLHNTSALSIKDWDPSRRALQPVFEKQSGRQTAQERERKSRGSSRCATPNARTKKKPEPTSATAETLAANDLCKAAMHGDLSQLHHLLETDFCDSDALGIHEVTPLHCASVSGHVAAVRLLLEHQDSQSMQSPDMDASPLDLMATATPLHWACLSWRGSNCGVVRVLLESGANVDAVDAAGWTPLMYAAVRGDLFVVEKLLENQASLARLTLLNKHTVLHVAAAANKADIVRLLVSRGINPAVKNAKGETPAVIAAQYGRKDALMTLLEMDQSDDNGLDEEKLELGGVAGKYEHMIAQHGGQKRRLAEDDLLPVLWSEALDRINIATLFCDLSVGVKRLSDVSDAVERLRAWSFFSVLQSYLQEHQSLNAAEKLIEDRSRRDLIASVQSPVRTRHTK